ncbi:MAG: hypothetical protein JRJ84_24815 [Deltaproteobacteria bacterium]|nr:hypothetical protein [Deltaproteobacteria bacterium]
MASGGALTLMHPYLPSTLALTHLATLGFLTMVMMGALYQMIPVVGGAPVPGVRSAHLVHLLFTAGLVCLVWGLARGPWWTLWGAIGGLTAALVLFLGPVGMALVRAPSRTDTVWGMRLALLAVLGVATLGLWMAFSQVTLQVPVFRSAWVTAHLALGVLGWVGGLIAAVSWQVVPMFYLSPPFSKRVSRVILALLLVGILAPPVGLAAVSYGWTTVDPVRLIALSALPAAVAVWVVHPVLLLRALRNRRRRRTDGSIRYWVVGLCTGLLLLPAAAAATFLGAPRWPLLLGWLALWGWAAVVVHGMLTRIVPFLVWFHRFSQLAGLVRVPSIAQLLSERRIRAGLWVHLASVVVGAAAIVSGMDLLARLTGVLLGATGVVLLANLVHVYRQRPSAEDVEIARAALEKAGLAP